MTLRKMIYLFTALALAACQHLAASSTPPAQPDYGQSGAASAAPLLITPVATSAVKPPGPSGQTRRPTGTAPAALSGFAPTDTPTPNFEPAAKAASSVTSLPTETPTLTPIPTYVNLRGEVIVEHVACLYGPGAVYLYKYGLLGGSNLEIIGRNALGTWIEIRAIGGNNPCWVKASLMKIKGDVMDLAPVEPDQVGLPQSPYYGPPSAVSAARSGDEVTLFWTPIYLKAGDDSGQYPYLVEAWVCRAGQIVFTPVGSYEPVVRIVDEPGCDTPSRGRVYTVEKHGYSRWRKIAWPQADAFPSP